MFDHNAMRELAYVKADQYQRNGGGGAFKVATSTKAYYDARGYREMSAFQRAAFEARERFKQSCQFAISDFRMAGNEFDLRKCEQRDAARYAIANIPF
ncbi:MULTISPECIES: hypothetical protein [unclassified Bradyrhizobium]|uniref:hypothetical protein n=1 Tax=unclassified Bradyrhizobium TaxID=2631580 RepID=UPI002FF3A4C9